jgi:hypothetical protein
VWVLHRFPLKIDGKEADMLRQFVWAGAAAVALGAAGVAWAQEATRSDGSGSAWRRSAGAPPIADSTAGVTPSSPGRSDARPLAGPVSLPNDGGQVWRDYDISSYTARITSTKRPEQAIIDWVLRETGYEAWHGEPLGVLSAGNHTLRVYHTPDMQKRVADVVDRFINGEAASYTFSLRIVSVDSPSWRAGAQRLLRTVPAQSPGANAWLLPKENAAVLIGELRRRSDYREHNSPYLIVNNGQSTVVSAMRGRSYARDVIARPSTPAGYEAIQGVVDEGFAIDFSPLLSVDRRMVEAAIRCEIDQVEKMIPVAIDVPSQKSSWQRTKIESPQMSHYRFHERFRWPTDQVLLVGLGMVALPIPIDGAPLVPGVPLLGNSPARADLLVFVECKGPTAAAANAPAATRTPLREAKNYRGRY